MYEYLEVQIWLRLYLALGLFFRIFRVNDMLGVTMRIFFNLAFSLREFFSDKLASEEGPLLCSVAVDELMVEEVSHALAKEGEGQLPQNVHH